MKPSDISRSTPAQIVASEETRQIARDAVALLGYETLQRKCATPLGDILRSLEIEVLNEKDVHRYQDTILAHERWTWTPLNEESANAWGFQGKKPYTGPIPQFVLRKAIQIKKAAPETTFFVISAEGDPDPFLWAGIKGFDTYIVEVWDEPKFENL